MGATQPPSCQSYRRTDTTDGRNWPCLSSAQRTELSNSPPCTHTRKKPPHKSGARVHKRTGLVKVTISIAQTRTRQCNKSTKERKSTPEPMMSLSIQLTGIPYPHDALGQRRRLTLASNVFIFHHFVVWIFWSPFFSHLLFVFFLSIFWNASLLLLHFQSPEAGLIYDIWAHGFTSFWGTLLTKTPTLSTLHLPAASIIPTPIGCPFLHLPIQQA